MLHVSSSVIGATAHVSAPPVHSLVQGPDVCVSPRTSHSTHTQVYAQALYRLLTQFVAIDAKTPRVVTKFGKCVESIITQNTVPLSYHERIRIRTRPGHRTHERRQWLVQLQISLGSGGLRDVWGWGRGTTDRPRE